MGAILAALTTTLSGHLLKPVSSPTMCMDPYRASTAVGTRIQQWTCNGQAHERVYFRQVGASDYQLAFQHSGLCLRVSGGSTAEGAPMVQDACARQWTTAARGTVFTLIRVGTVAPPQFQLKSTTSGLCLRSPDAVSGSQLVQGACATSASSPWSASAVAHVAPSATAGRWSAPVPLGTTTTPVAPAAAALRPDGKVVAWASWGGMVMGTSTDVDRTVTVLFDPATNGSTVTNTVHDMFCPGTALLADGRVHVAGGDAAYSDRTSIYTPATATWAKAPVMSQARWYNSSVTLADGRVLTLGGNRHTPSTQLNTGNGEIYDPAANAWTRTDGIALAPLTAGQPAIGRAAEHLRLLVAPDGRVIAPGPTTRMQWITTAGTGTISPAGARGAEMTQNDVTVMFDVGEILTAGGNVSYDKAYDAATPDYWIPSSNASHVIDVNSAALVDGLAKVQRAAPMKYPRTFGNGVVLPDVQVFVAGGIDNANGFSDDGAILAAEMFDPAAGAWKELPAMTTRRPYHSWAVLLLDGRVLVGGGGLCSAGNTACPNHPNVEIYSPPYVFAADRPAVTGAPAAVTASATGTFPVTVSGTVTGFSLVRMSSVTHSTNTDQRFMRLAATRTATGWSVKAPVNRNVAPPGYYMLFALNGSVPSRGRAVRIR